MRIAILLFAAAVTACSGSNGGSGFDNTGDGTDAGKSSGDGGSHDPTGGDDSGTLVLPDGGSNGQDSGGIVMTTTTVYANTDDTLYSMDPMTMKVTAIGKFAGQGGGTNDTTVTDVAVNANGDVYVNTESVVYKAALPAGGTGNVQLTKVATIAGNGDRFYALAFAPAGVLGQGEALVGGDGNGELWAIDPQSGATKDLGSFGNDPSTAGNVFALSGDIVFYTDTSNMPTGLATIRSCKGTTCSKTNDFLAGIDMTALTNAYNSGTRASSLLGGIYGGSASSVGNGIGAGEVFGLGAWMGDVYGFTRAVGGTPATPPKLLTIDTTSGAGTTVTSTFPFSTGSWSGAGVSTKTTITVPPPPPPPK